MYHMDEIHAGEGVLLWKDLTTKGEVNGVKKVEKEFDRNIVIRKYLHEVRK